MEGEGVAVEVGEAFEEGCFSFHDGDACFWSDVAESEDGGSVCDYGDVSFLRCVCVDGFWVVLDCFAGRSDAGAVDFGEVVFGFDGYGGLDADFPSLLFVEVKAFFV